MKKIKIVCTIGPASAGSATLSRLVRAGMNVARLNFSHGTYADHLQTINNLKKIRQQLGINIGILQDLSGPKIRVGVLPEEGVLLKKNDSVCLYYGSEFYTEQDRIMLPVNYKYLLRDIKEKKRILLDDGLLELHIEKKENNRLLARVIRGGVLKSHKGVNFPDQTLSQRAPTAKDLVDLEFGLKHDVDFVALSFVQTAADVEFLKKKIHAHGSKALVIAKLERRVALDNLDEIIAAAAGIMVARGDLGVETDISFLPIQQKIITRKCNIRSKPVIIATQMLESMVKNPLPTRAEVTDVANAVYDGSDALMLSAETALGKYPVQSVSMMKRIADNVERHLGLDKGWVREHEHKLKLGSQATIAHAVSQAARDLGAKWIIVHTMSGQTARLIAAYRPETPILAVTPLVATYYQLSLSWGITPILLPEIKYQFVDIIKNTEKVLIKRGFLKKGDLVVISLGMPTAEPGATNLMKIHTIGSE